MALQTNAVIAGTELGVLSTVAIVMSYRSSGSGHDLSKLAERLGNTELEDEIIDWLATRVRADSKGELTVRRADPSLFPVKAGTPTLHVAVCPSGYPVGMGMVTSISAEITLYYMGTFNDGHGFVGVYDAMSDKLKRLIAETAEETAARKARDKAIADGALDDKQGLIRRLMEACEVKAAEAKRAGLNEADERRLDEAFKPPFLFDIGRVTVICRILGLDLDEFITEVVGPKD